MSRLFSPWLIAASLLLTPLMVHAQTPSIDDLLATANRQLASARSGGSEAAYKAAEAAFDDVLAKQTDHPQALIARGEVKFFRARVLAVRGDIAASVPLFQSGMADMDRAVVIAPQRMEFHLTRGLAYGPFPALYNLAPVVRSDLEFVVTHAEFNALPIAQRARVWLLLGTAYANAKLKDEAANAFRQVVGLDATSAPGKEASELLSALNSGSAFRPDRFSSVTADASPLLVVVSFTRASAASDNTLALMKTTMQALKTIPGLLNQSLATSVDTPGMFLLFTWWKDKQAVNNFYYSDLHQQLAGTRGQAITGGATFQTNQMPTQLGIEVLAPLPGGMQMGGGFIPKDLFRPTTRPGAVR